MKSLLGQAETPVPDGAWEAIRARIPAAKPGRSAAPWWWAGVSLAAAAAVALAFVLGGTFRSAPSVVTAVPGEELAQEIIADTPAMTETVESIPGDGTAAVPSVPSTYIRKSAPRPVSEPAATQDVTEEAPAAEPTQTQGIETASTRTPSAGRQESSETKGTAPTTRKQEAWSDPFARMAYEDAHRKANRHPSLQINGLVGTNDKMHPGLRNGMMAAPAKAQSASGKSTYITEEGESVYAIPVSFGLGTKFYLSDRWALGTGVNYSLLSRTFPGSYTKDGAQIKTSNSNIKHTIQYIGIPVNLYYDVLSTRFLKMYTFAGGSLEKGISQKYTIPGSGETEVWKQKVPGLQGSAALGAGIQMNLADHLGLYLDPSARYYFGADQPKSIRTQQNVMFNLELGIRLDL